MSLAYWELTSFDDANPQGYDDTPDFAQELWPLIVKNAHSFDRVVEWLDPSRDNEVTRVLGAQRESRGSNGLRDHGSMSTLDAPVLMSLRERSSCGGHLSVMFETTHEEVLVRLISLYRRVPQPNEAIISLDLPTELIEILNSAIESARYVLAFGHDGDPMDIFGDRAALSDLAQRR